MHKTSWFRSWHSILLFLLAAPFAAKSEQITVNSNCELGCSSNPALTDGQSISGNFDFNVTVNGDVYNISGGYGASYSIVNGSEIIVTPTVTYTGSTPITTTDTISFAMDQSYFDTTPGSWAGAYTETVPLELSSSAGAGSTIAAELFYDGEGLGLVGPYGPGSYFVQNTENLDFGAEDTSDTLSAEYDFSFVFAPGAQPGATAASVATPEPATIIPGGFCLVLLFFNVRRRNRVCSEVYNRGVQGSTIRGED
jgi:hypothetical protein